MGELAEETGVLAECCILGYSSGGWREDGARDLGTLPPDQIVVESRSGSAPTAHCHQHLEVVWLLPSTP